jgi:hypothetical protein
MKRKKVFVEFLGKYFNARFYISAKVTPSARV